MSAVPSAPFDITGPLPHGLTLLEASAGTGKTFAIAALATRYVAEGLPLDQLLVVTFTRAATGELRDRIRRRLVGALEALDRHLKGLAPDGDTVHRMLIAGLRPEVVARQHRLAVALADFDRATIVTTHAFCEEVLHSLGTAGDVARDVTFLEDPSDLLGQVVDDFYVRKFAPQTRVAEFDYISAQRIAAAASRNLGVSLVPGDARSDSTPNLRYRFATNVRAELARRKQLANTLGYDDVLRSLSDSLEPVGATAASRLRDRFRVVLVDEFQDTDPTQWQILHRAFVRPLGRVNHDPTTVILVGDPKQAIYSFRGADVFTYLDAATQATDRRNLPTNWRSDQSLLDGVDALLDGATLGDPQIRCLPAQAAHVEPPSRLVGGVATAPVRVRILSRSDRRLVVDRRGVPSNESIRQVIADDLAADVALLLTSGAGILGPVASNGLVEFDRGGDEQAGAVLPGDVAVLVGTNRGAAVIRSSLEAAGIPAVIHGGGNVFAAPVARQWLQLLEALERPTSTSRARSAALTDFVGWEAGRLAGATDAEIGTLQATLHTWTSVLQRQGVGALLEMITVATELPKRVLGRPDGERLLTDIHHIGELLHAEVVTGHLGAAALTAWIRRRIAEGERTDTAEERSRRLESDADAVQVLTIHRSKGLEFPVVYLPDLADHRSSWGLPSFHDPETGKPTQDVGGEDDDDNPLFRQHRGLFEDEQRGEDLRQAYVAMTRARQQIVLWWGPFKSQALAPLTRLLLADRDASGLMRPKKVADERAIVTRLGQLDADAPGRISVETATHDPVIGPWASATVRSHHHLSARVFERPLDTGWRRTSYTAITAGAHQRPGSDPAVGSETENDPLTDEVDVEPAVAFPGEADAGEVEARVSLSPMAGLDRGADFGVLVHSVLETAAFDAPDLPAELASVVEAAARFAHRGLDRSMLATALTAVIETPLGPSVDGLRLRDLARSDRLHELGFELPLVGGDSPHGRVTVADIAGLISRWLPGQDPLNRYTERLGDPALATDLRGYLTGSIDLLLRHRPNPASPATSRVERYVIVDYKTNWLGPPGEILTAWHYRPAVLADAMVQAHYPLQALLYLVALHRYLRWRLNGYQPDQHLGGVLYLFVRGMLGDATPLVAGQPCGVFSWQPPAGLVVALSDLFDRGPA